MKPGDTVKHSLTGIVGEVTRIFRMHTFDMITVYSNGHYVTGISEHFNIVTTGKIKG